MEFCTVLTAAERSHSVGQVLESDEFWIIEWFANWCGGCRMVSPWYKEAATKLKARGIQFGAMDMDVHGKLGNSYGVSGMPHIMAFLPGDPSNPIGMGGLGGAASIINFAEEQFESLSEDQRSKALAATLPPPPPAPPSTKTEEFFASLGLQAFSAGFLENGHATTTSLSALDAYDLGELGMYPDIVALAHPRLPPYYPVACCMLGATGYLLLLLAAQNSRHDGAMTCA